MKKRNKIIIIVSAVLVCIVAIAGWLVLSHMWVGQGVSGNVYEYRGNCMPPGECPKHPISVKVEIYTPVRDDDLSKSTLVASTISWPDGTYSVSLPPGLYSVIPIQNGHEKCNSVSGNGIWCDIEVKAGELTNFDVEINNAAW